MGAAGCTGLLLLLPCPLEEEDEEERPPKSDGSQTKRRFSLPSTHTSFFLRAAANAIHEIHLNRKKKKEVEAPT